MTLTMYCQCPWMKHRLSSLSLCKKSEVMGSSSLNELEIFGIHITPQLHILHRRLSITLGIWRNTSAMLLDAIIPKKIIMVKPVLP